METPQLGQTASHEDDVFFVSLHFKGMAYAVPVQVGDTVSTIFDFVQEALHFPRGNCRLIHRGKQLRPGAAIQHGKVGLTAGSKLLLVASSAQDVAFVLNSRADPLVKGFEAEDRDERSRKRRAITASMSPWGTKQDLEFRFNSIKAEFKYITPTPYDAEHLLEKLACDPGIIEIMKTRQFKVGIFTEMSPVEAQERMAKEGTPNMDLLGYNQNSGEKIVLRLRTDTLKGFRPYHDLINTLIHELTHNVWGPHDHNFWNLFGELKAQYMRFHRFWSHGGHTADSSVTAQFGGFDEIASNDVSVPGFGQVLGGAVGADGMTDVPLTAAERRVLAADALAKRVEAMPKAPLRLMSRMLCGCGQDHEALPCQSATEESKGKSTKLQTAGQSRDVSFEVNDGLGGASEPTVMPALVSFVPNFGDSMNDSVTVEKIPSEAHALSSTQASSSQTVVKASSISEINAGKTALGSNVADPPSAEDLPTLGLDGSATWVESFARQLHALHASDGAIRLLLTLVQNVVNSPDNVKFRSIRAGNPKIQSTLLREGEVAESLLGLLGFNASTGSGEKVFVLRDTCVDSVRLRLGAELLEQQLLVDPVR